MSNSLKKLALRIKKCKKCSLWRTRIQAVPGEGNLKAKILIIGEAPGKEEDKQGRPFCGRAGKFLDELLKIANLKRQEVFITNVVKCRPPKNRRPKKEEIEKCRPWLVEQIKILKPKLIITLGALALNWFSSRMFDRLVPRFRFRAGDSIGKFNKSSIPRRPSTDLPVGESGVARKGMVSSEARPLRYPKTKISQVHGCYKKFEIGNLKLKIFSTYHPAAAFRRGNLRKILKKDFTKIQEIKRRVLKGN
ncbi:MAG: uracil-DNA glycosylase family protein [Patescibacteria group bacterium]